MKGFFKRAHGKQGGFTLIELIIVIAILGVLAAIALPNFNGITTRGKDQATKAEMVTVQTAVDVMMANENLTEVDAANGIRDMSAFPSVANPIYPDYMRSATTNATYDCSTTGLVTTNTTAW